MIKLTILLDFHNIYKHQMPCKDKTLKICDETSDDLRFMFYAIC